MRGMIIAFLKSHWFNIAEVIGIAASVWMSASALSQTRKRNIADLHFSVGEAHDRIWNRVLQDPELGRVKDPMADLENFPVTMKEERFILLILSHLTSTLHAIDLGSYPKPEKIEEDVRNFFSLPVPGEVLENFLHRQEPILQDFMKKTMV